jgi:hypothetical protein
VSVGSWQALVVEEPQSALVELGGGDPFDHRLPQVVEASEPSRPTVVEIGEPLLTGKARARPADRPTSLTVRASCPADFSCRER